MKLNDHYYYYHYFQYIVCVTVCLSFMRKCRFSQVNIVIFINVIRILVQKLKSSAMAGNNDTGHFM